MVSNSRISVNPAPPVLLWTEQAKNAGPGPHLLCSGPGVAQPSRSSSPQKSLSQAKVNSAAPPRPRAFPSSPPGPPWPPRNGGERPRREGTPVVPAMCRHSSMIGEAEIRTHNWCAVTAQWRHLIRRHLVILGLKNVAIQTKLSGLNIFALELVHFQFSCTTLKKKKKSWAHFTECGRIHKDIYVLRSAFMRRNRSDYIQKMLLIQSALCGWHWVMNHTFVCRFVAA